MNNSIAHFSLEDLKAQAKRLRVSLAADGTTINHSKSLEMIAAQYGFRDWNTLHAAIGNRPSVAAIAPVYLGQKVSGTYLNQAFEAEVLGIQMLTEGRYRVKLHFDDPVDVIAFDSFSSLRRRVSCTVNAKGTTAEKTSDGKPQLQLNLYKNNGDKK